MVNRTISHYRIVEKLGEGGMGVVYKAEDTKLERTVALKFLAAHLLQDVDGRKRFEREAKAAAALNHPNICTVYEIDDVEGRTFIAMAFLEGESLDKKIEGGPLKLEEALDAAVQTAEGLQAAHEKGIVHRDIKPANLMLAVQSAKQQVTIMDFGLAQLADRSKLTKHDETMGTVAYMSPEQTYGMKVDRCTDIWSLGVVIYEMITGQQPFQGHYDKAVMYSITDEQPEPMTGLRTGVPMELEWIVDKCLAKRAEERYQSAAEMIIDLTTVAKKLASGKSAVLQAPGAPRVTSPRARQTAPAPTGPPSVQTARAAAGDSAVQRSSLRALKSIGVVVESAGSDAADCDLPTGTWQTDVELKMRVAGIEVRPGLDPRLHISVQPLKLEGLSHYLYSVKAELNQAASLVRDAAIFLPVRTWHSELVGIVETDKLNQVIRDAVSDLADEFVNAYLSVNPK
jgi:serine/threonine protein kinase